MYFKNEKILVLLIRYALPLLVLFLSVFITTFLYFENKAEFKQLEQSIEEKFIRNKKQTIKEQIDNIYNYIISEQDSTVESLKESLINRVHEAHTITTNIYAQFKDTHTKDEITLMIRTALKDIRFNNQRGYFFLNDIKGINIMHPLVPKLEGHNLINLQNSKGKFIIKETISLLKDKDESYKEWYWKKIKDNDKEFKKIGFVKNIYELGWYIGTGEYIDDFSKDVQKKVAGQIEKFRFGKNGYFIITDKDNNYINHINKKLIGKNAFEELKVMNDFESINKIQSVIDQSEGYVYLDFFKPNSTTISSKIIYLKTIPKWGWVVSTGFYKDDVQTLINDEKKILTNKYNENLKNVLMIASIASVILILISFYISSIIQRKFKNYNDSIDHHIKKNQKQHELLAQKTKLAAMGEMLENIAHQWRQPLSVITTASTGIKVHKEMESLTDELFNDSIDIINSSAQHLSATIEDFKEFFQPDKEKTQFNIDTSINKTLNLLSSSLKVEGITVIQNIEAGTINGYERELLQVFLNIFNNAKDALLLTNNERFIFIEGYKEKNNLIIKIKDSAGGIQKNIIKRIFEPYFTTKHQSQGTGIGLYMSQEIITRHMNGKISVENVHYKYQHKSYVGACFTILLPE